MNDVCCPNCDRAIDINHDDGYGYGEDETYQQECLYCGVVFVYTTTITFDYEASVADCLNGAPHNYKATTTHPKEFTEMECSDCGERRKPTEDEIKIIMEN